jgi:hypothetical protein
MGDVSGDPAAPAGKEKYPSPSSIAAALTAAGVVGEASLVWALPMLTPITEYGGSDGE